MTQTLPTRRPQTRPRALKPGTKVSHLRDPDWVGEVHQSDAFYDTLRLRGVGERQQALVHWPEALLCTWELTADLTEIEEEETP